MTGWRADREPTGAHGGWPAGDPPPSRLPAVLGILAVVVIVAAVVVIILVNRGAPAGLNTAPTPTTARPTSSSTRTTTTSARPTTSPTRGGGDDRVANPAAKISYRLPRGWTASSGGSAEVLDVEFAGVSAFAEYDCGGSGYSRAFAASAAVQNSDKRPPDARAAARAFAGAFARDYYPKGTIAGEPTVREGRIGGKSAVTLTARVATTPTDPACQASAAEVVVVAVDLDNATADRPAGLGLVVVVRDTAGGPADPAPAPTSAVTTVTGSVELG
ncbi:hypothetical protein [Actinokineospora bangkokensis]|uniref:DUF8017 domain-containing protein n=1 Tax=Actinokineospora bangkokensis TaxID=1193682 RepID=A0A1Q9LHC1_9PSEU|nr:hypothetical protein [Actinokineospora bangkokensis]OLR91438.1 hypothetical protein BJP25_00965 [Actinokineospora bangkokensis]